MRVTQVKGPKIDCSGLLGSCGGHSKAFLIKLSVSKGMGILAKGPQFAAVPRIPERRERLSFKW